MMPMIAPKEQLTTAHNYGYCDFAVTNFFWVW